MMATITPNPQVAALCDLEFSPEEIAAFVEEADRLLKPYSEYAVFRRYAETAPTMLYDLARPALMGSILALSLDRSIWIGPLASEVAKRFNPISNIEQKILFERLIRAATLGPDSSIRSGLRSDAIGDDLIEHRVQAWVRGFPITTVTREAP